MKGLCYQDPFQGNKLTIIWEGPIVHLRRVFRKMHSVWGATKAGNIMALSKQARKSLTKNNLSLLNANNWPYWEAVWEAKANAISFSAVFAATLEYHKLIYTKTGKDDSKEAQYSPSEVF